MSTKVKTAAKKARPRNEAPVVYRGVEIMPAQGKRSAMSRKLRLALIEALGAKRDKKAA